MTTSTQNHPDPVLATRPLGFPWETYDPFLFCVHHDDAYPAGNEIMGPDASLAGRNIGQDFEGIDGWRMYHGEAVPGFPQHPHRGFETVTIARRGFIDHSDSLGAAARFGRGDVQWMTAGGGVVHSEMFPLLDRSGPNPAELFQIWLNLPPEDKLVEPHFAMLWAENIPVHRVVDRDGRATEITVVAGELEGLRASPPPPHSWASRPESHVAIWSIKMADGAAWTLPAAPKGVGRTLYFFGGDSIQVAGRRVGSHGALRLVPDTAVDLVAGRGVELLLLQGRPIGKPVAQYGPFVMNSRSEIQQAMMDYQRTRFGGWPWPDAAPVHPRDAGRFARRPDGSTEHPPERGQGGSSQRERLVCSRSMAKREPPPRGKLLVSAALTASSMWVLACSGDRDLPGNPKGSNYDGVPTNPPPPGNPKGSQYVEPDPSASAAPSASAPASASGAPTNPPPPPSAPPTTGKPHPVMPANPKGSFYDPGMHDAAEARGDDAADAGEG